MAKKKKKTEQESLTDALSLIAPGTKIREGIKAILQSGNGALLCFGEPKKLAELSEGGVKVDSATTPQILYEICKMDGAILLNSDGSRILFANRFLVPDHTIPSDETGTRHRSAERVAKQTGGVVVAVSERRSTVTLYVSQKKYVLDAIPTLLNKASQALQTLEKYIAALNQSLEELSAREFQDMVTIFDVCKSIQRCEMVKRIGMEIEPYLLELGTEGRLIALQKDELVLPVDEAELVIRDYFREKSGTNWADVRTKIHEISQADLLNLGSICQAIGFGANLRSVDTYLSPRGYRILTQTHRLTPQLIDNLVDQFGSLQAIVRAPKDELCEVEGVGEVLAERIRSGLNLLRSQLALDMGTR
jgi:diadenylate cyclase